MTRPLSLRERVLYHQVHPLKLAVDVSGSIASAVLFWKHLLAVGMLVALLPSIAVSAAMISWMDLHRQKESAFGHYVALHMTRVAEGVRFGGQIIVWIGAWVHAGWGIAAGAVVIVLGWTYSLPRWVSRVSASRSEPILRRDDGSGRFRKGPET